jgi:hypothetical protein
MARKLKTDEAQILNDSPSAPPVPPDSETQLRQLLEQQNLPFPFPFPGESNNGPVPARTES